MAVSLVAVSLSLLLVAAAHGTGVVLRASTDSSSGEAGQESDLPAVSADGQYVVFASAADNLVPDDTNSAWDVFVKDTGTGDVTRVSTSSSGTETSAGSASGPCLGSHDSGEPSISADGRFIAFSSCASDLVPGDTNDNRDIFVKDTSTSQTTRVSTNSAGEESSCDGIWCVPESRSPSISANGRYVAFLSFAQNLLTPPVHTGRTQVYVKDRLTEETSMVSTDSSGIMGSGGSMGASISGDGRYVAFWGYDDNLVPGDTNDAWDIHVKDRLTGETTRVSTDSSGSQSNGSSSEVSISSDGRYVAFKSHASNLVDDDTNNNDDVFVKDRITGQTTRASTDSTGLEGYASAWAPSVSAHGRYVSFASDSTNLVPGDTNWVNDVFVKAIATGETIRVSQDSMGLQGNGNSDNNHISADGRFAGFRSWATNLVPDDTNGKADVFKSTTDFPPECSQPSLILSMADVFWASDADYDAGILSLELSLENSGDDTAGNVTVVGSTNTNGVVCISGMPMPLGTILQADAPHHFTLQYSVPGGVASFHTTIYATANNSCGLGFSYPSAYPGS